MISVKVVRLAPDAVIPARAHPGDAGYDLVSIEDASLAPGERRLIGTGIAIELPEHTEAQLRPRSGLAVRHGLTVLNAPGTIDAGYRGEVKVLLINLGSEPVAITGGMRIAQLVICPVAPSLLVEADALSASARAQGGFGSTGS